MINSRRFLIEYASKMALMSRSEIVSTWDGLNKAQQENTINVTVALLAWGLCGRQSVQMPATFEAAMAATDERGAVGEKLPWPSFEIPLSQELHHPTDGRLVSVLVSTATDDLVTFKIRNDCRIVCSAVFEKREWNVRVSDVVDICRGFDGCLEEDHAAANIFLDDALYHEGDSRWWVVIGRLVCGAVMHINAERERHPGAYGRRVPKRGKASAHFVGRPLDLDCRGSIGAFLDGRSRRAPSVTTLVRGHWRNQVHGEGRVLRRRQWIQPFYRGEGPMLVRPVKVGFKEAV